MSYTTDDWTGCYPSRWKGMIVDEAMAHPAKFSSKLIRRIYEHMTAEGWLHPGDVIIDPFGGVALGALDAMRLGLQWIGCELEPRFVELGQNNIGLWNSRYSALPKWNPNAGLLEGDSRHLLDVINQGEIEAAVSSPPWEDTLDDCQLKQSDRKELAEKMGISNTEFISPIDLEKIGKRIRKGYSGAISSPPFRQSSGGVNQSYDTLGRGDPALIARHAAGNAAAHGYGETAGQLANLQDGDFEAAISSPPYEAIEVCRIKDQDNREQRKAARANGDWEGYNRDNSANLGNTAGDDFWSAARAIVEQVHLALAPGGHAVWVCKDFVKDHQVVPFSDRWRQLCEAVGFVTLHEHHALLVQHKGISIDLEGNHHEHKTEAKSFFRRLAESKGSPRIDFEVVWCMEKPKDL